MAKTSRVSRSTASKSAAGSALSQTPRTGAAVSKSTGRAVPHSVRVAAAKARVSADKKRNVKTEAWIVDLASKAS